mmetsp:Transcript_6293/g.18092  ORF Transcript_6293/g.18092 Transcript_6293/m.18092 type:complete len:381 (+) Transcript_6293:684-1826(+)
MLHAAARRLRLVHATDALHPILRESLQPFPAMQVHEPGPLIATVCELLHAAPQAVLDRLGVSRRLGAAVDGVGAHDHQGVREPGKRVDRVDGRRLHRPVPLRDGEAVDPDVHVGQFLVVPLGNFPDGGLHGRQLVGVRAGLVPRQALVAEEQHKGAGELRGVDVAFRVEVLEVAERPDALVRPRHVCCVHVQEDPRRHGDHGVAELLDRQHRRRNLPLHLLLSRQVLLLGRALQRTALQIPVVLADGIQDDVEHQRHQSDAPAVDRRAVGPRDRHRGAGYIVGRREHPRIMHGIHRGRDDDRGDETQAEGIREDHEDQQARRRCHRRDGSAPQDDQRVVHHPKSPGLRQHPSVVHDKHTYADKRGRDAETAEHLAVDVGP